MFSGRLMALLSAGDAKTNPAGKGGACKVPGPQSDPVMREL